MSYTPSERKSILLVDDDPDDTLLTLSALRQTNFDLDIISVGDGFEALEYLQVKAASRSKIKVVLVDLNMPEMSGIELLKRIRASESTRFLPVVIFSGSTDINDLYKAYAAGANGYIRKPDNFAQYTDLLHMVVEYWVHWNEAYDLSGKK